MFSSVRYSLRRLCRERNTIRWDRRVAEKKTRKVDFETHDTCAKTVKRLPQTSIPKSKYK